MKEKRFTLGNRGPQVPGEDSTSNLMAKPEDFSEPTRNSGVKLIEFVAKKVVRAFHNDKMILAR